MYIYIYIYFLQFLHVLAGFVSLEQKPLQMLLENPRCRLRPKPHITVLEFVIQRTPQLPFAVPFAHPSQRNTANYLLYQYFSKVGRDSFNHLSGMNIANTPICSILQSLLLFNLLRTPIIQFTGASFVRYNCSRTRVFCTSAFASQSRAHQFAPADAFNFTIQHDLSDSV